jgi:acetylornithine deacetylase/succinyl-diaminopimelate desuccinylase-like protein
MKDDLVKRMIDLAIAIQQIPAPTFHEQERAEFVRSRFVEEGIPAGEVRLDEAGNAWARVAGEGSERCAVVSAHLDTVFQMNTDLTVVRSAGKVSGAGIGDNALGVAGLFGLLWNLREGGERLPGDLWLVANVREEGLGNLDGIRAVVDFFKGREAKYVPSAIIALEGIGLGHVYHRGLGVRRRRITVRTAGGHSWIDAGDPSAVHELMRLGARLAGLVEGKGSSTAGSAAHKGDESTPARSTLNIGVISGGWSVNTIAAEAMLELDLRSDRAEALEALSGEVEREVEARRIRLETGVTIEVEAIGDRPWGELSKEHPLVRLCEASLRGVGVRPQLSTGSTDANLPLSLDLPAVALGLTSGGGAHSMREYINVGPLGKGMEALTRVVRGVW